MKIDHTQSQNPLSPTPVKAADSQLIAATQTREGSSPADDSVEVSDAARAIGHLEKHSEARVAELRQQIQSGQYKVDSAAVGKRIVQAALEQ